MKARTVEETRLVNARALAKATKSGISGMAKLLGKQQSQMQNTIGKTPNKQIGSDVAREIEAAYGKAPGWLDMPWDLMEAAGDRLTRDGSKEAASAALESDYRDPNDVKALQWISGALVAHLFASRPDKAGDLIRSLEALPDAYQETGPGAALLVQLETLSALYAASGAAQPASERHGNARATRRSRP
jgi:hypothetical protein